jgi:hypothetical protein
MAECYHSACDSVRRPYTAKFADMPFYKHIVQTLLNTMIEMSKSQCLRNEDLTGFYRNADDQNEVNSAQFLGGSLLSLTQFLRRYMPW